MNLVVNARDAMPRRRHADASRRTRRRRVDDDGTRRPGRDVVLAVATPASAWPSDVAQRIFEPFFTTKEIRQGPGLGPGRRSMASYAAATARSSPQSELGGSALQPRCFPGPSTGRRARHGEAADRAAARRRDHARRGRRSCDRPLVGSALETTWLHGAGRGERADALAPRGGDAACIDLLITDVVMPGCPAVLARTMKHQFPDDAECCT